MRTYKISKGWAVFVYIGGSLLIALFVFILIMPFIPAMEGDIGKNANYFLIPMSVVMIVVMLMGMIDVSKSKFVIDDARVYSVGSFLNRELRFDEIAGFRLNEQYIFIEPKSAGQKRIKISNYVARHDEIIGWLNENFDDLDKLQHSREAEEILENEAFGASPELRQGRLVTAHRVAKILNWAGGISAAWLFFYPKPYEYAVLAAIAVPLVCIAALKYFKGLVRVDGGKDSAYPTIFWAIMMISLGLVFRAFIDFTIFDYNNVWLPVIVIAMLLLALIVWGNSEFKRPGTQKIFSIISLALFLFAYGFGSVITLNCLYDKFTPEEFTATVLNKRISSGKTKTYYLEITAWGPQKTIEEVSVPKSFYETISNNNSVYIYLLKGRFGIPWFVIE